MYRSIAELVAEANRVAAPLSEVVLRGEIEQSERSREDVLGSMRRRLHVMRRSAEEGLREPKRSLSGMSGGAAYEFAEWQKDHDAITGPLLSRAVARAMAVNEVNAAMGCIVATPTAGSAGILPAVLLTLQEARGFEDERLIEALLTAAGIGSVIVHRASVSGAAGGCQAETGSAAAMAAGAGVELLGGTPQQVSDAVAMTLKNMLGLVCDPVGGLVEIPCVKRNAAGVAQCFVAIDLAMAGIRSAIPADEVIDAMGAIGRRMDSRFKETAQGGLAASPTGKALAEAIWKGR